MSLLRWLAYLQLPGVSRRERLELLQHFGSLDAVYDTGRGQLTKLLGDRREALQAILDGPDETRHQPELEWLAREQQHLVTWADADYPPLLRQIPDPPLALYVIGDRAALSRPQLAIVGSRNPTPAGRENARAFARHLAGAGLAITSGLALGIDGAAHRGALEASGGATLAVVATGLDRVYPARHRELAHEIARAGALISEFPLGTPPLPENFPIRNRLISGLALGVLVVEAAVGSGSLITARLATDQGREVFAIPGSIHSPLARGCHALIRQGAKLVETAQDILEELGALARAVADSGAAPASPAPRVLPAELPAPMAQLLICLGYDPASIDQLVERSGLTTEAVSSMLLQLELQGLVEAGAGGKFQRIA
ncbi:MAG: DNA-processing protein DprA [Pseudomonadota bacterium]